MPKVSDAHKDARRRQILRAAFTCFGRDGVHGSSMTDICEESDLSPGAVYNYFDGKADIIRAIAAESRGSLDALFETEDGDGPASEVLKDLLLQLGTFVEQPGDAEHGGHRVRVRLWSEALRSPDVRACLRDNQEQFVERFADLLRRGQADGTVNEDVDPVALARGILALHQGMVLQAAVSPDDGATSVFEAVSDALFDASA